MELHLLPERKENKMEGREEIGKMAFETLFSGKHETDTTIVTIAKGKKHVRGEILGEKEEKCEILGETGYVASYILAEDADATDSEVSAVAYKSGGFIKNSLIVKPEYTVSSSDIAALRNAGIYLEDAQQ